MNRDVTEGLTAGHQLAKNLTAALLVAGPCRQDGKPRPLRSVDVLQNTGLARSTLRALKNSEAGNNPNPDLRTLNRLATMLGIPVAFLLMRPEDWKAIGKAIDGIRDTHEAASRLSEDDYFGTDYIVKILRVCGVHPDKPPFGGSIDSQELERMCARNEWRRRTGLIMGALTRSKTTSDRSSVDMIAAFAASFVNQTTPPNPSKF